MRTNKGLTLIEVMLTCVLVTFMSFAIIDLTSAKRHYSAKLSANTSKIYLLESTKNRILFDLESGKSVDEVLGQSYSLVSSNNAWETKIYRSDCASVSSIIISVKPENDNRFHSAEVVLP